MSNCPHGLGGPLTPHASKTFEWPKQAGCDGMIPNHLIQFGCLKIVPELVPMFVYDVLSDPRELSTI
jgi:hypothetical protein